MSSDSQDTDALFSRVQQLLQRSADLSRDSAFAKAALKETRTALSTCTDMDDDLRRKLEEHCTNTEKLLKTVPPVQADIIAEITAIGNTARSRSA